MKGAGIFIVIVVVAVFLVGLMASNYSPGNIRIGSDGALVDVHDPRLDAQATRMAQEARDDAAKRAVEIQIVEAQADKAKTLAEAERAALPATALRNILVASGIGVGALVLAVGTAFAAVAWMNKRATSVYPNTAGMYPVIIKRSWNGVTIVHDPNRALGPTTIYTTPSPVGLLLRQAPEAQAQFPLPGSEQTMAQLSTQAQAVGLMAAVTRPNGGVQASTEEKIRMVQAVTNGTPQLAHPLPEVHVIDDPAKIERFERMLEKGGE